MGKRNRRYRRNTDKALALLSPRVTPARPYPMTYGSAELGHVVLMGDSIIDNESYTEGKPDVAQRLHSFLGDEWKVSLLASDGATTSSMDWQTRHIPPDATHIIVSIGGNDANGQSKILRNPEWLTMREALEELWIIAEMFKISYQEAIDPLLSLGIPVSVCTIYDCDFEDSIAPATLTALSLFNDAILRYAYANGTGVIDLRSIGMLPEDYVMTIEPGAVGGAKIAAAMSSHLSWITS